MKLQERIALLERLGLHLQEKDEYLEAVMHRTEFNNKWFTINNQQAAVTAVRDYFLESSKIRNWIDKYNIPEIPAESKTIGLVLAGNIPLVGFHDWLCVFVAGHKAMIKLSDKDKFLLPYLLHLMETWDSRFANYYEIVPQLKGFNAVIATGSNNSARYFEAYFGKVPHIIRRNRNAVAVLSGKESEGELAALGQDVFSYFGLGCRNVAKLYVPKGYNFEPLLETFHQHKELVLNSKYKNNFDYNFATLMLNKVPHLHNGCVILLEDPALTSRIACLHYEYYDQIEAVEKELEARKEEIQLVVAQNGLLKYPIHSFGEAQAPTLSDYADGVDTLTFLLALK